MERVTAWVKEVVELCMFGTETEKDRRDFFVKKEEEYGQFSDAERKSLQNAMMKNPIVNDAVYVLSLIIQYTEIKDLKKCLWDILLREDFDCFVGSMLGYQVLTGVKGEYYRKRLLYKRNMEKFEDTLRIGYPYLPVEKRNKKRIVIITGQILSVRHSPTKVIMDIAYILQEKLGYEILLFVCPCNLINFPKGLWYGTRLESTIGTGTKHTFEIIYKDAVFQVYKIDMSSESLEAYRMMFSLIFAWRPAFVLDANTANPIVGLAGRFTTVVSLPMSMGCPISEGEILVRYGRIDKESEKEYTEALGSHQVQLFIKERFPILLEESEKKYSRAELDLPEDKFLIAVVGNRLYKEIDLEFVHIMKLILKKVPDAAFVMIGKAPEKGYFKENIFKGHYYELGYCEDLMGVYQVIDLYLNPKREGGGFSAGMALIAGVPVVTLPFCDVHDAVIDYGDTFVVHDYAEMVACISRYVYDPNFYQEKKEYARRYKTNHDKEELFRWVKEFIDGIMQTIEKKEG